MLYNQFLVMNNSVNTIRLNEQQFHALIEESVKQVLSEGRFGNMAGKIGKGLGKAALYGALGAGSLAVLDKGLENQDRYRHEINQQAKELNGPTKQEIAHWLEVHDMPNTPENREMARESLVNN